MAASDRRSPQPPIRLVIVDADRRVRESLASLVGSGEQVEVVGGAGQPGAALDLIETHRPDVVIVDPRLPEIDSGLALLSTIRRRWPTVGLLAMGWSDELEAPCRSAGIDGFIPKTHPPNEFVEAIVAAGARKAGPDGAVGSVGEPVEDETPGARADGRAIALPAWSRTERQNAGSEASGDAATMLASILAPTEEPPVSAGSPSTEPQAQRPASQAPRPSSAPVELRQRTARRTDA